MKKKHVNLLEERRAPSTVWERLYSWMANTCRLIVVLATICVLMAFGWEFWLHRGLASIEDDIVAKGDVLKSLSDEEVEIRKLQNKMSAYRVVWEQSSNMIPIVREVNEYVSSDIEAFQVSFTVGAKGRQILVDGKAAREDVVKLENNLKDSDSFADVVLSSITRDEDVEDMYVFSLAAKVIYDEKRQALN